MGFIQWFTRLLAAGTLAGVLALAAIVAGARAHQADQERRWYAELEAIREARRDAFASTILSVGSSSVPFPDEPPLVYPDPEVWAQLIARRRIASASRNEVLLVTTQVKAEEDLLARIFPVAHLGQPLATPFGGGWLRLDELLDAHIPAFGAGMSATGLGLGSSMGMGGGLGGAR